MTRQNGLYFHLQWRHHLFSACVQTVPLTMVAFRVPISNGIFGVQPGLSQVAAPKAAASTKEEVHAT